MTVEWHQSDSRFTPPAQKGSPRDTTSAGSAFMPRWRGPRRAHHRTIYAVRPAPCTLRAASARLAGRAIGLTEKTALRFTASDFALVFVVLGVAVTGVIDAAAV